MSLVRPIVEYGAACWDPYREGQIAASDRVQKKAAKFAHKKNSSNWQITLDAGLLARSQHPEGPATGHHDTGFSWFPCVYKRRLRWFPSFQVATTCL